MRADKQLLAGPERPIFRVVEGVVYVIGTSRSITWIGAGADALDSFLAQLAREPRITAIELDGPIDPAQPDCLTLRLYHPPRPHGTRARGSRGSRRTTTRTTQADHAR